MPEEQTQTTTEPPTPAPVTPEVTPAAATTEQQNLEELPQWARDSLTKANREAANYRTQVAELKPKADQFSALEEASKTEAQRLSETAATAQRDADEARAEAIRYKAAATHGIPADHFDLLGTGTEEEITARAEKLAALLAVQAAPPTVPATPVRPLEQLRPGATPGEPVNEEDAVYAALFGPPKT